LILGPRGTGKTKWVRTAFPDALYIDLLNFRDYTRLQSDPARLEAMVLAHDNPWVIIDEVQKIPSLLNEVHRLIEHEQRHFILTGSSSRKLKREGVNLLAGRARTYYMHPLIANEIGEDFDFNKALKYGLLPISYTASDSRHFLESYVATYLREEVLQEGLVRNLGTFSKFMEIASFSQGGQLNLLTPIRFKP
jgi:predicted AAA+ superfamily ATPase